MTVDPREGVSRWDLSDHQNVPRFRELGAKVAMLDHGGRVHLIDGDGRIKAILSMEEFRILYQPEKEIELDSSGS